MHDNSSTMGRTQSSSSHARPARGGGSSSSRGTDGIAIRKSIQQLKAELRGAERLHAKKTASGDFAADDSLRKRSEAKIAALKAELASTQGWTRQSVKFFERIKASRRIEQLRKQIAKAMAAETGAMLQEELKRAEFDLSGDDESNSDSDEDADDTVDKQPTLSEKAIKQRDQVRAHLQSLIDLGLINVAETVNACVGEPGEEREKKKTKKKGDTEEDVKHKQIGHLLRGVGVSGLSDDDENEGAVANDDSSDSSDSQDDMDQDDSS
ncbi:hypothetical protein BCR44DRAFT_1425423 [Catenaria anguillulae PL171]|uniref:Uncharacterized protein n=1 Tax=Catenaria anguillulae PL171 TaxID=765915 RepID=A0A1Y2I0F0_9FUNG|nr:hypothetical protein BCR44DRAFT_1425423 [Catenaria anguillulae PL171]